MGEGGRVGATRRVQMFQKKPDNETPNQVSLYEFVEEGEGDRGMVLRELATRTNVFVGGDEMVHRLMLWCERRKPFQESMLTSKTAIFKLRKELRSAIKTLTVAEEAMVEVDSVVGGYDLALMLTREDFERECSDIFDAVADAVALVLALDKTKPPSQVVLLGGASRVPKIQSNLNKTVAALGNNVVVKKTVDLDRGMAMGLAAAAASEVLGVDVLRVPLRAQNPIVQLPLSQRPRLPAGKCKAEKEKSSEQNCTSEGAAGLLLTPSSTTPPGNIGALNIGALQQALTALREENEQLLKRAETAEVRALAAERRAVAALDNMPQGTHGNAAQGGEGGDEGFSEVSNGEGVKGRGVDVEAMRAELRGTREV